MSTTMYSCFVGLFFVAVGLFLVVRTTKVGEHSLLAKTLSSVLFIIIGALSLLSASYQLTKLMIVLGLVLGLVGDILLDLKVMHKEASSTYLNGGMLSFGAGHILYFVAVMTFLQDKVITGYGWVVLASFALSMIVGALIVRFAPMLKMDFSGFKFQNWLYSSLLIFMTIITICLAIVLPIAWILAAGFVLFLASDLILSAQYFGGKQDSKVLTVFNHVLYYLAQLLIASFAFFI